jgi:hypothetical protein
MRAQLVVGKIQNRLPVIRRQQMCSGTDVDIQMFWSVQKFINWFGREIGLHERVGAGTGIVQPVRRDEKPRCNQRDEPVLGKRQLLNLAGKLRQARTEPLWKSFRGVFQPLFSAASFAIETVSAGAVGANLSSNASAISAAFPNRYPNRQVADLRQGRRGIHRQ